LKNGHQKLCRIAFLAHCVSFCRRKAARTPLAYADPGNECTRISRNIPNYRESAQRKFYHTSAFANLKKLINIFAGGSSKTSAK